MPKRVLRPVALLAALAGSLFINGIAAQSAATQTAPRPSSITSAPAGLQPILEYIDTAWTTLSRSMTACSTIVDPKLAGRSTIYVPADFPVSDGLKQLEIRCNIEVKPLPKVIHKLGELDVSHFDPQGLLYLEHPYIVPGGRFNEMYGWDSYFIIRGLLRAGKIEMARGMVENFFFEIEHYGAVLNANRTYYLSRSQPPFLTSMILGVYDAEKAQGRDDRAWLEHAYNDALRDHQLWVTSPHLAGDTGLSRYFDFGEGPAPESLKDETDHYQKVAAYFLEHPKLAERLLEDRDDKNVASRPLVGSAYTLQLCGAAPVATQQAVCDLVEHLALTPGYYKGDRSMRESGFDISFRFSPFGADTHHFAAVCLNSLLYKEEKDLETISRILGRQKDAEEWRARAARRQALITQWMWDAKAGEFFDYNFMTKERSTYEYASTFYPLWAGLATRQQAAAIVRSLPHFARQGGFMTSPYDTGAQWDAPYAWAPIQFLVVEGLRRYGYNNEANQLAFDFLSTVALNFRRDHTIREKYNAVTRSSDSPTTSGYSINVVGFGWTNATFLEFLHDLPAEYVQRLAAEQTARK